MAFLHQRWVAGCKHPTQLWHEIVTQGYRGTPRMVRHYIAQLGQRLKALTPEQRTQFVQAETTFKTPTVRRATFWVLKPAEELTLEQEAFITQLCTISPEIKEVQVLSHAFAQMLRERQAGGLLTWLENIEQISLSRFMIYCASQERRHPLWPVYGSPMCSPAPQSFWISPA